MREPNRSRPPPALEAGSRRGGTSQEEEAGYPKFPEEAVNPTKLQLVQLLPDHGKLVLDLGKLEGDLRLCTYNGNTWNSAASVHEWMRKKGLEPHIMLVQETRFSSPTAEEQAHGWANRGGLQLACSGVLRTGEAATAVSSGVGIISTRLLGSARHHRAWTGAQHRVIARRLSLGAGTTISMISIYLEEGVGLKGANRQLLEDLHEWCAYLDEPFIIGGDWNVGGQS